MALRAEGYDITWMVEDGPGADDQPILGRAQTEHRVLLTSDKDFGELVFRYGLPADEGVVLSRLEGNVTGGDDVLILADALRTRSTWVGYFSVIERDRVRMTPIPPRS